MRQTREEKKKQAFIDIINQMFVFAELDLTFDDVKDEDRFFAKYTMTMAQAEAWQKWGEDYLVKKLRMRRHFARQDMAFMNLCYGLAYSDYDYK